MKRAWAAMLAALVVVLPTRLWAAFRLVDLKTGFYTDGGRFAGIIALLAAAGVSAAIILGVREAPAGRRAAVRSNGTAALAALSGMFIAGQSLAALADQDGLTAMHVILAAAGVCAAVAFLMAAYDFATGAGMLRSHPLVALLPSVWGCLCLISLFVDYAAVVNRFDNVYHTFTVVFLLLFLFSQAKMLSGVGGEKGAQLVFAYGFAAVIMAVTDAVPNLARYFVYGASGELGSFPTGLYFANIFLAAYIIVFLAAVQRTKISAPIVTIAPSVEASGAEETPEAAEKAGGAEQTPEPADPQSEKTECTAAEPTAELLDFLQNKYAGAGKFVEKNEIAPRTAESVKS